MVYMAGDRSKRTHISSYTLVYDGGDVAEPTAFPLGVTSGGIDLLSDNWGKSGSETDANELEILITGDQAGTGTVLITGACEGGPEEPVASLAITVGTVVESGTRKWVDTMVLANLHLSPSACVVEDSGNSHPAKFGFDAIGYRYISFYPTLTTITNIRIYARFL